MVNRERCGLSYYAKIPSSQIELTFKCQCRSVGRAADALADRSRAERHVSAFVDSSIRRIRVERTRNSSKYSLTTLANSKIIILRKERERERDRERISWDVLIWMPHKGMQSATGAFYFSFIIYWTMLLSRSTYFECPVRFPAIITNGYYCFCRYRVAP